jgi:type IV pilus assembly protein PilM
VIKNLFSSGNNKLLGVELTPERIAVAQMKQQGSALKLTHYVTTAMPAGAMVEDRIVEPTTVGMALSELLTSSKIKPSGVASAIPSREAVVRLIRLPGDLPDSELRNIVLNQEAELYIPFPRNEADIDYQPLGIDVTPDGREEIEVLLVATPKEVVDNYLAVFNAAGLMVKSIELSSFALIRAVRDQLIQYGRQEAIALVSLGYEATEIAIVVAGIPRFTRTINIGTAQMQEVLSQALNAPVTSTGSLLKSISLPIVNPDAIDMQPASNPGSTAVARVLTDLADELQRSIDFFSNQDSTISVVQIVLAGIGATIKEIDLFLNQQLGRPVLLANPLAQVNVPNSLGVTDGDRPSMGVAIGLGLRET